MARKPSIRAQARRALDSRFRQIEPVIGRRPSAGWIRAIRDALGMSGADLAKRMGVSQPRVAQLEKAEVLGDLKISTLERVADALDCDLVYALVPRSGSLEADVRTQARAKAVEQAGRAAHTMLLEDQAADAELRPLIDELIESLITSRQLWR